MMSFPQSFFAKMLSRLNAIGRTLWKKYDEKTIVALLLQPCRCRCCCPSTKLHFAPLKLTYCIFNKSEILSSDMTLQLLLVIMALELSDQNRYLILFYFSDFIVQYRFLFWPRVLLHFYTTSGSHILIWHQTKVQVH